MSISYIIFVFVCLAASVGLQLYIRKKMRELPNVAQWIQTDFEGDISDRDLLQESLSNAFKKNSNVACLKASGLLCILGIVCNIIYHLNDFMTIPFWAILGTTFVFIAVNDKLAYYINPLEEEMKEKLYSYLDEHWEVFMLANLDDRQKVYKLLNTSSHQQAKKIIQAFKDTGRIDHIPLYLKKLLNSKNVENQLMGLEHLSLVDSHKELELLILAYQFEVMRFPPNGSIDPRASKYRTLFENVPEKLEYELNVLSRIIFHPLLDRTALTNLVGDNFLGMLLVKIMPITPLKLAQTNHPHLVTIGYRNLTDEEIYTNVLQLANALDGIKNISNLINKVKIKEQDDSYVIVTTPHEEALKLSRSRAINTGKDVVGRLTYVLRHLQGAQPQQYFCKTCMEKSFIFRFNERYYPICPVCKRLDRLELSVLFPVIVGVIGLKEYTVRTQSKEIHLPVWNEAERKALNTKIEVLEIWETENLSYDWAINAVVNVQLNLQPDVRVPVRLVGNPPLSQNSRLILGI